MVDECSQTLNTTPVMGRIAGWGKIKRGREGEKDNKRQREREKTERERETIEVTQFIIQIDTFVGTHAHTPHTPPSVS